MKNEKTETATEKYTLTPAGVPRWKDANGRVIKSIPRTAFFHKAPAIGESYNANGVEMTRSDWRRMAWTEYFNYEIAQAEQNKADYLSGLDPVVAFNRQLDRLKTQLVNAGVDGDALEALLASARAKGPDAKALGEVSEPEAGE